MSHWFAAPSRARCSPGRGPCFGTPQWSRWLIRAGSPRAVPALPQTRHFFWTVSAEHAPVCVACVGTAATAPVLRHTVWTRRSPGRVGSERARPPLAVSARNRLDLPVQRRRETVSTSIAQHRRETASSSIAQHRLETVSTSAVQRRLEQAQPPPDSSGGRARSTAVSYAGQPERRVFVCPLRWPAFTAPPGTARRAPPGTIRRCPTLAGAARQALVARHWRADTGKQVLASRYCLPGTGRRPGTGGQTTAGGHWSPGTGRQTTAARHRHAGTGRQAPAAGQLTAARHRRAGADGQAPAARQQRPGTGMQAPAGRVPVGGH